MRQDLSRMTRHINQKVIFFGCKVDLFFVNADNPGLRINVKVADNDRLRSLLFLLQSSAPQVSTNPRQEFIHAERLGYVIVRAFIEGFNLAFIISPHGKNDDGDLGKTPNILAELDSAHVGHDQVGNDEIRLPRLTSIQAGAAIICHLYLVALRPEAGLQNPSDLRLIVHNQNPRSFRHGSLAA